jgi:hypothetical protein
VDDRRHAERQHTLYHSKVYEAGTRELIGHTVDISATGLRLVAPEERPIGEVLDIECELPKDLYGHDVIELRAIVRWCKRDVNPEYAALGLELIDVPREIASILRTIQLRYCFDH